MKVVIVAQDVGSESMGMVFRPYYIARELKKAGHDVTLIGASFSHVRRLNPTVNKQLQTETIDDIRFCWIKTPRYQGNGLMRMLSMFLFPFLFYCYHKKIQKLFRPDLIIASSPNPLTIFGAYAIKKKYFARLIFEVRDIWPLSLTELGGFSKNNIFIKILQFTEDFAYKKSDYVISLLVNAFDHMQSRGLKKEKFVYLPNCFLDSDYAAQVDLNQKSSAELSEFRKQYPTLVGYAGAHGLANGLQTLIQSASELEKIGVGIVLLGNGPEKNNLKKLAESTNVKNVLFLDSIPKLEMQSFLQSIDICYIGLKSTPLFRFGVSPNKLIDYMAAAKPVIMAIDTYNDPVELSGCGIRIQPENKEELINAVRQLSLDKSKLNEYGQLGFRWLQENMTYQSQIPKLEELLLNKKNILYVNHYAGSLKMGMEFRPFYLAREWQKQGHQVKIIASTFTHLRHSQDLSLKDLDITSEEDVNYQWLKTNFYEHNDLKRLINVFTFLFKLIWFKDEICHDFKPDVIIASSTYPLDVVVCYLIAKKYNAKLIHEVHDLWPLTLIEINEIPKYHPFILLLQWAENFSYRYSDKVVSMLPGAFEYMKDHGLDEYRYQVIPNGICLEDFEFQKDLPSEIQSIIDSMKNGGDKIIGYAGFHSVQNDLFTLLNAISILKKQSLRIKCILIGHGPLKQELKDLCHHLKLQNDVYFFDSISKHQALRFMTSCDFLYMGAPQNKLYKYGVSPNKLLEYMIAGKPILYSVDAYNNWVQEANSGCSVLPSAPELLSDAIINLLKMSDEQLVQIGKNGNQFAIAHFQYVSLAKQFLN